MKKKMLFVLTLTCFSAPQGWASEIIDETGDHEQTRQFSYGLTATSDKDKNKIQKRINHVREKADNAEIFSHFLHYKTASIEASCDLGPYCKILDQGALGSCTANALSGMFYALQAIEEEEKGMDLKDIKPALNNVSRLFIYYQERAREGTLNDDSGASLGSGIISLFKTGAPYEVYWSYSDEKVTYDSNPPKFMQKPSAQAYQMAIENKDLDDIYHDSIVAHEGAYNLEEIKKALHSKQPIVMGMVVHPSFESQEVMKTGMVPMPQPNEPAIGGHAVLMVGYDDEAQHFKVANSWGENWGDHGFFYLPYEFFTPQYVVEMWKTGRVSLSNDTLKRL